MLLILLDSNRSGIKPGALQWSHKLTPGQRQLLDELPVPQANPESVYAARQATLALFLREAPAIAAANNVAWPTDLADAVLAYLERENVGIQAQTTAHH